MNMEQRLRLRARARRGFRMFLRGYLPILAGFLLLQLLTGAGFVAFWALLLSAASVIAGYWMGMRSTLAAAQLESAVAEFEEWKRKAGRP